MIIDSLVLTEIQEEPVAKRGKSAFNGRRDKRQVLCPEIPGPATVAAPLQPSGVIGNKGDAETRYRFGRMIELSAGTGLRIALTLVGQSEIGDGVRFGNFAGRDNYPVGLSAAFVFCTTFCHQAMVQRIPVRIKFVSTFFAKKKFSTVLPASYCDDLISVTARNGIES